MKKRNISISLTAVAIGLSLLFGGAVDAQAKELTKPTMASVGAGDEQETCLVITTVAEFKEFAANADAYDGNLVQLGNDIQFDGTVNNYTPPNDFGGRFDGCGYTISGINVSNANAWAGLFGWLSQKAVIENVTVENSSFSSKGDAGGIAAYSYGGKIMNCHVKNTTIIGDSDAGGIIGYSYPKVYIANCSSDATVTGKKTAGGIVGNGGSIHNCWNRGNVTSTWSYSGAYATGNAGGIVGTNKSGGTIQNSYNIGSVSTLGESEYAGGIVGWNEGTVINCYCTADNFIIAKQSGTIESNKQYSLSEMQTESFLNLLNNNRGNNTDWYVWEIRSDLPYPQHKKLTRMNTCNVALEAGSFIYNGNPHTPDVVATSGGYTLVKDIDYELIYKNNINAGIATVTIRGKGMFIGNVSLDYNISRANPVISYKKSYKKTYGNAAFNLNAKVTAGESALRYTSSNSGVAKVDSKGLVTVKGVGITNVTISIPASKNYNAGSVVAKLTVKPKKQTAKLSAKGKKLTISWKRDKKVTGYELQYAFDKKFKKSCRKVMLKKNSKTSYKIKKRKKTYYVRVRSYKNITVNGKKQVLYGSWSSVKKMTY